MDELAARLKHDATQIRTTTTIELQARLAAQLRAARTVGPAATGQRRVDGSDQDWALGPAQHSSWLISGLTGIAALALVILLINWHQPVEPKPSKTVVDSQVAVKAVRLPEDWILPDNFSLTVRPADLTRTLDEELVNLKTDLEKARTRVENDIKFAF